MFTTNMKCFFLFLIFLGTQLRGTYGWEIDETSSVTSVQDGDTFYISGDTVRLADINSPETGNEPGYSIAKYALTNMVGGQTVYLDTDQKSGRDPYDRLIAVVYVRYNSTHYVNVNKALIVQGVAVLSDYTNNEFSPSAWTLYVRYANDTIQTIVGPMGPQGVQGPKGDPGDSAPMEYVYASMGISIVAVIIALIAITRRK